MHFQDLKRSIHLTALQVNQKADYLVDLIRAGMLDKLKLFFNDCKNHNDGAGILQTRFQLKLEFGKKMRTKEEEGSGLNESEDGKENVKMILSPIHIAIMSKHKSRPEVVNEIGRFIDRLPEPVAILQDVLEQTISLPEFKDDRKTWYKSDRKLDGMNAFHLASIFSTNSLKALFNMKKHKNLTEFEFSPFLKKKNTYLGRTPLHSAVRKRTHKSTR